MSDIYKIGVALMLTQNGIAPALSAISHQLIGIHRSVGQINSGFGRWRTALMGAASVMAGSGILGTMIKIGEYADKFLQQQAQARVQGLTILQVEQARLKAYSNARAVPGSNLTENFKTIAELNSVVGFDEAIAMSKKMAQLDVVMKAMTGKEGSAYTTARAGELLGVFTDKNTREFNAGGFDKFVDIVGRVGIASHGRVTPEQMLNFAKQAGPAAGNLTDEGLLKMYPLMQAMGGFRAGTAAQALNRQFAGGIMSERVANELMSVGIANKDDFKIGKSHQVIAKSDAMKELVEAMQHDLAGAIQNIIAPKLIAGGFDTNEKLAKEIYRIIGTGPAQRQVYETIRGGGQMTSEVERAKLSQPLDQGIKTLQQFGPLTAKGSAHEAFNTMMTAISEQGEKALMPVFTAATNFFNRIGEFAQAHPNVMLDIAAGFAALGVFLVGAGGVALLAAFGVGGGLVAGFAAAGAAVAAFIIWWDRLIGALHNIQTQFGGSFIGKWMGFGNGTTAPPASTSPGNGDMSGDVYFDSDKVGRWMGKAARRLSEHSIVGPALFDPASAATPNDSAFAIP